MAAAFEIKNIPCIQINGHGFTLKMNEVDMLERSQQLQQMGEEIQKKEKPGTAELLIVCRAVEAYINDLCGDGAMDTMVNGVPIGVMDTIRLLGVVNEEAARAFNAALVEKYE